MDMVLWFLRLFADFRTLEHKHKMLVRQMDDAHVICEKEKESPARVIGALMGRGIQWFDYNALPYEERVSYYNEARSVLQNKTLANEIKHYISDLVEEIATRSQNQQYTENLRFSINGVSCLMERLESLADPRKVDEEVDQSPNTL